MSKNAAKYELSIPKAPGSIEKGSSMKELLSPDVIRHLARNISHVHPPFPAKAFIRDSLKELEALAILQRGHHLAASLRSHLPEKYEDAVRILLKSLTPPLSKTEGQGLAVFFYLPHVFFIANYGVDKKFNDNEDPFEISMLAQYEITRRFSCEFSIRPFLIRDQKRTLKTLESWTRDPDPHVRRLCSEGTRPKLPWAVRIPAFVKDPSPAMPILESLKDDVDLYVRRSVANHLGDIAKDHLPLVLQTCARWLDGATAERKWLIRHALRYPAKKGDEKTLRLRKLAK